MTLIFDIGKTNKKYYVFDENGSTILSDSISFDEIQDEDGFPCEDIDMLISWVKSVRNELINEHKIEIEKVNFSAYGASFVHIDDNGNILTPLYNYLKPFPENLINKFYSTYGDAMTIGRETASPQMGFLNSGMQLYWLKYYRPEVFSKIKYSIHFPQYLSYIFTNVAHSEYTCIGTHTNLWNYSNHDYHQWVYQEGIADKLPSIAPATQSYGNDVKIGLGIHDSSSSLYNYMSEQHQPFILLSTGTWSIAMNPFTKDLLTDEDLKNDCLFYMNVDGSAAKASRLFLGNEYALQIKQLEGQYPQHDFHHIKYSEVISEIVKKDNLLYFNFESLPKRESQPSITNFALFYSYEHAYHQLMKELMDLQIKAIDRIKGKAEITKIIVDGGFTKNELFIKMLSNAYPALVIEIADNPIGAALGAFKVLGK
jgi:L-fuculokinase